MKLLSKFPIVFILLLLFQNSCKTDSVYHLPGIDFGTASYYESFLFVPEKNTPVSKTFDIEFNEWAITKDAYVWLQLVDTKNDVLGTQKSNVKLYANNELCDNGVIKLQLDKKRKIHIKIEFLPSASNKKYPGYVVVANARINRINNIDNVRQNTKIYEWNATYNIIMNPLKKWLLIFFVFIIITMIIWFTVLRNLFYKKMKKGKIELTPHT